MIKDLVFCLNATVPLFLLMLVGMFLRRTGMMGEKFTAGLNSFVFRVTLPLLLFYDMSRMDVQKVWDGKYVLFCFLATCGSIALVTGISYLLRDRSLQGEFIQVAYRSSAALLGAALVQNLYGNVGMVPLMIIGAVPLYNVMAVVVLSFYRPGRPPMDKGLLVKTLKGIVTNPIIIGVVCGLLWSVTGWKLPAILDTTIGDLGKTASPLGLMALGASFNIKEASHSMKEAGLSTFIKLVGLPMILLPIAVMLGFRDSELVAVMIMSGSSSTVSAYVMAKEMGHKGVLTASAVMLSTLLSSVTLTMWLFILRTKGLI